MKTGNRESGFTLLELMVVLSVLIFIAAMVYPAAGRLNDMERQRITHERMEEIRRAIIGDPDRFDAQGLRIIGGYVGDMGGWPDLYEPAAQQRQNITGTPVFDLNDPNNPTNFYYRPAGYFTSKGWQWQHPYRKLTDDTTHTNDHIGGLETENEGQPLGLWTDDPRGDGTEILDPSRWQGPYLLPPMEEKPEDTLHFAENDGDYEALEPALNASTSAETWEDGDYTPTGVAGEHFDDKEDFRLRQTENRLTDGWNRALRFFITADAAHPGETIFWMISEGFDFEGKYPTKGTFDAGAGNWVDDINDTMANNYDPTNSYNRDNIVMKIYSREFQAIFDELNQRKRMQTEETFSAVRRAILGELTPAPDRFNSGFTGALGRWPRLFQWEGASWDNENADHPTPLAYTKGQPRGLWTAVPNNTDPADNLLLPAPANPGFGWRNAFLPPPFASAEDEKLMDSWGREILFFNDELNGSLLVLSRGPDGMFDFYDTDTLPTGTPDGVNDFLEPAALAEVIDNSTYSPNDHPYGYNADNVVMLLEQGSWQPGWFTLKKITVLNAIAGVNGTKAMFVYGYDHAAGTILSNILTAAGLTDIDGDGAADDWTHGGTTPNQAFDHSNVTTGTRALVLWNDTDGDDVVDSGEYQKVVHYNIYTHNGHEPRNDLRVDTVLHFTPAP